MSKRLNKRETGLDLLKKTLCKTGGHVFIHTSAGTNNIEPPQSHRCDCEMYTWSEWSALLDKQAQTARLEKDDE